MIAEMVPLRPTDLAPTPFETGLRRGPLSLRRDRAPPPARKWRRNRALDAGMARPGPQKLRPDLIRVRGR